MSASHRGNARLIAAAALLAAACATPIRSQQDTAIQSQDTTIRSFDGRTLPAALIRIEVPERRSAPTRTITVAALRIPAAAERPGRPIVFLMGGPGIPGSVMAAIPPYFTLFERLRAQADVIIVDQRGIGRSEPGIDCPFGAAPSVDFLSARARLVAVFATRIAACAEEWRARGHDVTAYNTLESADDIEALREAIGAEQIDLLAFSYGSRLALAYLQRHGERVGRVVLQGVNGPGLVLKSPVAVARKLRAIGVLLEQDTTWTHATDLLAAARAARERLMRAPATITVTDRATTKPVAIQVGRDGLDAIVGLNLDDARLPALLVSLAGEGDDRVLARFVDAAWNGLASGTVGLMARAVNCAADRPAARWRSVRAASDSAPFGMPIDNEFLTDEFCRVLGYRSAAVEFTRPVSATIPILLVTGTLDATNPVENAVEVARHLPGATLLAVENAVHESLPVPAVQDVVVAFFQGAPVPAQRIRVAPPRYPGIEAAAATQQPRGR